MANALRHGLHHQPQSRSLWRAFGLAQQAGRRALPRAGHGAQHFGQLAGGVLGEGFVHLALISAQGLAQRIRGVQAGGEKVGVKAGDVGGVSLHKAQIQRVSGRLAVGFTKHTVAVGVHADVKQRTRPAPVRIGRRRAHRHQRHRAEMRQNGSCVDHRALRYGAHGSCRQRHRLGHR